MEALVCGTDSEYFPAHGVSRDDSGIARYDDLPASVVAELEVAAAEHSGNTAVVDGDRTITYAKLWSDATRVSAALHADGLRPGDRVAVRMADGIDWITAYLGVLAAGAVAVPINTRLTDNEVDHILADSGARTVITSSTSLLAKDSHLVVDDLRETDPAALFYTSGTTGKPKGALLTHGNLLSNIESVRRAVGIRRDSGLDVRAMVTAPFFHVMACNSQLLPVLTCGGLLVMQPPLARLGVLSGIAKHGITHLSSAPAAYHYLLGDEQWRAADLKSVRWLGYGAAPASRSLIERIHTAFPNAELCNGYGLTEATAFVTVLPGELALRHAGSIGVPAPVVDVAVLPGEDDREPRAGQLLVRGPNVAAGYWRNPEATARTFRDGWLHTGDFARIDDGGRVHLLDRMNQMINRGGENVYCVEVENALAEVPGVLEAAVVGVPDDMMGEKVGAVLVVSPGTRISPASVTSVLQNLLADYKMPQYFRFATTPLPRNASGKVLKSGLSSDTEWIRR